MESTLTPPKLGRLSLIESDVAIDKFTGIVIRRGWLCSVRAWGFRHEFISGGIDWLRARLFAFRSVFIGIEQCVVVVAIAGLNAKKPKSS